MPTTLPNKPAPSRTMTKVWLVQAQGGDEAQILAFSPVGALRAYFQYRPHLSGLESVSVRRQGECLLVGSEN